MKNVAAEVEVGFKMLNLQQKPLVKRYLKEKE